LSSTRRRAQWPPRRVTDRITRNAYTPYGAVRGADNLSISKGWLNQISDEASTGLVYLNARYYDTGTSRFVSPDPLMNPADPRTLDAFMYANNNPITYFDPTGLVGMLVDGGARRHGTVEQTSMTPTTTQVAKIVANAQAKVKAKAKASAAGNLPVPFSESPFTPSKTDNPFASTQPANPFQPKPPCVGVECPKNPPPPGKTTDPIGKLLNSVASFAIKTVAETTIWSQDVDWGTMLAGGINLVWGAVKIDAGLAMFGGGAAADATGVGAIVGVPAGVAGAYEVVSGAIKMGKGAYQLGLGAKTTPSDNGVGANLARTFWGVVPFGGWLEKNPPWWVSWGSLP
jgi:RHS repeat-associated protein